MTESTFWFGLALCGLATLLIGLAVFLFIAVMRFSGRGAMGVMSFFMGASKKDAETDQFAEREMAKNPAPNLTVVAQQTSFDDALRAQGVASNPGQSFTAQNTPSATQFNPGFPAAPTNAGFPAPNRPGQPPQPPAPGFNTPPTPRIDALPPVDAPDLRPRRDTRHEDDMFGGLYDGDGP